MKFIKFIKSTIIKLKELWNIYGGIALSTLIAYLSNWSKNRIDLITSYMTLTLVTIGALTYVKFILTNKKKSSKIDVIALSSDKRTKQINTALNPTKSGENLGKVIIYTVGEGRKIMKKIGNFFKWLWGNKLTLTSIISNLVIAGVTQYIMFSDMLLGNALFAEHKVLFVVTISILCALWLADNIFCVVSKYGLENIKQLDDRHQQNREKKLNKLTPEKRRLYKGIINNLKERKDKLILELASINKESLVTEEIINSMNVLKEMNIRPTSEQEIEYNKALNDLREYSTLKVSKEKAINQIKDEINGLKERL